MPSAVRMSEKKRSDGSSRYLDRTGRKIPKNRTPYQGGVILYDPWQEIFAHIYFGNGDNDVEPGCDDYIMTDLLECPPLNSGQGLEFQEFDGGQLDFNRKKRKCGGDIRALIEDGLEIAGYVNPKISDFVYICSKD